MENYGKLKHAISYFPIYPWLALLRHTPVGRHSGKDLEMFICATLDAEVMKLISTNAVIEGKQWFVNMI